MRASTNREPEVAVNLTRTNIQAKFPMLNKGMKVYTRDGEKLGKIDLLADDHFQVEKGLFFPKEFSLRYDDITEVTDDGVRLRFATADLTEWKDEHFAGWGTVNEYNIKGQVPGKDEALYARKEVGKDYVQSKTDTLYTRQDKDVGDKLGLGETDDVRWSIVEEELRADKTRHKTGEVKIRKVVHTELRYLTVPVTKEEVRIERTAVTGKATEVADVGGAFQAKTVTIPVMEEEVTVSKRPVVKEEVHVFKERHTEDRKVQGEVRKEDIEIEGEAKPVVRSDRPDTMNRR
jgi:uncharacterized protein (TIGR02271 family)